MSQLVVGRGGRILIPFVQVVYPHAFSVAYWGTRREVARLLPSPPPPPPRMAGQLPASRSSMVRDYCGLQLRGSGVAMSTAALRLTGHGTATQLGCSPSHPILCCRPVSRACVQELPVSKPGRWGSARVRCQSLARGVEWGGFVVRRGSGRTSSSRNNNSNTWVLAWPGMD